LLLSGAMLIRHSIHTRAAQQSLDDARQSVFSDLPDITIDPRHEATPLAAQPELSPDPENEVVQQPLGADAEYLLHLNISALQEENPDVLAWIAIPGTGVDHPLLRGCDNNEYLYTAWDGSYNIAGSIFIDSETSPDFSDFNSIIYGHNMADGSMFGTLTKYRSEEFCRENPVICIADGSGVFRYEIFSVHDAATDSPAYWLGKPSQTKRKSFIANSLYRSVVDLDLMPGIEDKILTLSTCLGNGTYRERLVIQAVQTGYFPAEVSSNLSSGSNG